MKKFFFQTFFTKNQIASWDKYLLENYPVIWETKAHYFVIWAVFFISPLVFGVGFLSGFNKNTYDFWDVYNNTQILFYFCFSFIFVFYIFWQNIFSNYVKHYNTNQSFARFGAIFLLFFSCWFCFMMFPFGMYTNFALRFNAKDLKKEAVYLVKMNTIQKFLEDSERNSSKTGFYMGQIFKIYPNYKPKDYIEKLKIIQNIHSFLEIPEIRISRVESIFDELMRKCPINDDNAETNHKRSLYFLDFVTNEKYFDNIAQNALIVESPYTELSHEKLLPYEYDGYYITAPKFCGQSSGKEIIEKIFHKNFSFPLVIFLEFLLPLCILALFALSAKNFTFQQIFFSTCAIFSVIGLSSFLSDFNNVLIFNIVTFLSVLFGCNLSANSKISTFFFGVLINMVFVCEVLNFFHLQNATKNSVFFGDLMLIILGCAIMWGINYLQNEHKISPKS